MTALGARLARHVAAYAAGDILVRAAAFLLLPLFTRRLSVDDFGVLGLVQMLEAVLALALNLGMSTAILRRRARRDPAMPADVFSGVLAIAGLGVLALGVLALASGLLSRTLFGGHLSAELVVVVGVGVYFATLKLLILSILRADGRPVPYATLNLAHFLALVGTSVVLVAGLDMGLTGAVVAQAGSVVLVVLAGAPLLRGLGPPFRLEAARRLLAYGAPLMPGTLALWVITMSNRLFLEAYRSVEEVGLYTLGFRIALVLQIALVSPFRTAWLPMLFKLDAGALERVPRRVLSAFTAGGSFVALGIALFAPEIVGLLAPAEYASAAHVVPPLLLGYLLYGVYFNVDNGVVLGERTRVYPFVTGSAALLNVVLNAILVPRFGLMGAAGATLLSYPVLVVAMYVVSKRIRPIPYDRGRAALPVAVAVGLYLLSAMIAAPALARAGLLLVELAVVLVLVPRSLVRSLRPGATRA